MWSANYIILAGNRVTTFAIKDTKIYVPLVTLSTHDNTKTLHNWNQDYCKIKYLYVYRINRIFIQILIE